MKLFNKTFFCSPFILSALIGLSLIGLSMLKIEGMIQKPEQVTEQQINPFAPLQNLCKKCATKSITNINAPLLQKVFKNTFVLVCAMVVQQNNPKQSKELLENKDIEKEFDKLLVRLKEYIIYNAAIANQGEFVECQCFHPNFYSPILYTLDTEVAQLLKKKELLIYVLDDVISTGQRPEYLDDAQHLHDAINSQLWQNDLLDAFVNASATCIIL